MAKGKRSNSALDATAPTAATDATTAKREQPLQAVLLADIGSDGSSYGGCDAFRPLDLDLPKVLCPLNNAPLISYALDFLARARVHEVYVVCTSDAVEAHLLQLIKSSQSSPNNMTMSIKVVKDSSLTNAGDALREIDKRNVITSDPFVLLWGDVVTNVSGNSLQKVILAHKERRKRDSANIMTLLFKPVGPVVAHGYDAFASYSPLRSATEDLVVGLDPTQQNRILLYHNASREKSSRIPCGFFQSHGCIELRTDLLDVGIDLCSPDVLARMADEFDYRDLRMEFVANSAAEEEEGLQNKLYAHLLDFPQDYAARVTNLHTYSAISRDLLQRWCYPVVPDNPLLRSHYNASTALSSSSSCIMEKGVGGSAAATAVTYRYQLQRHYVYYECSTERSQQSRAMIGRSSSIAGPSMIGSRCVIGEHVQIRASVLGHACQIRDHASIVNCHVWDGVIIGSGASIQESIVGQGCVIGDGAVVHRGCVLGAGVVIGKGCVVPEFTRITLKRPDEEKNQNDRGDDDDDWGDSSQEEDDEGEEEEEETGGDADKKKKESSLSLPQPSDQVVVSDPSVVGPDGKGRVWTPPNEKGDEDKEDDEDQEENDDSDESFSEGIFAASEIRNAQTLGFERTNYYRELARWQAEDSDDYSEDEEDDDGDLDAPQAGGGGAARFDNDDYDMDGSVTFDLADSPAHVVGRQRGVDVIKEMKQICLEFEDDTAPIENLAIELNSFKFSQNASYSDCTTAATLAILEKMNIRRGITTDGKLVADFKAYLERWAPLLRRFSFGIDEEKAIVLALERSATAGSTTSATEPEGSAREMAEYLSTGTSFRFLLQTLHDEEIVSEDAILTWAAERREMDDVESAVYKLFHLVPVQAFLDWLEAESEGDESDDDDQDDDD